MTKFVSLFMATLCLLLAGLCMAVSIPFGLIALGCVSGFDCFVDWAKTFYSTSKL